MTKTNESQPEDRIDKIDYKYDQKNNSHRSVTLISQTIGAR